MLLTPSTIGAVQQDPIRRTFKQASLDLRFAENKSLVDAINGNNLIDFTRASSGTYVGSDGLIKTATTNEPRFTHDPVTGESLGLLVEEQRVNALPWSENFTDPQYIPVAATIGATNLLAPDGTNTATLLLETTTAAEHYIQDTLPSGKTGSVTHSVFAKAAGRNFADLRMVHVGESTATSSVRVNLTTGAITLLEGLASASTVSVRQFPNGWHRISISVTLTGANTTYGWRVHSVDSATGVRNYAGDPTKGILIWGAQSEDGAFPTSYIKSTGNTLGATRAADVASISGSNFSSWYRQDEGTVFMGGRSFDSRPTGNIGAVHMHDNSLNNEIQLSRRSGSYLATGFVSTNGVTQADMFSTNWQGGIEGRLAAGLASNNAAISFNGQAPVTDASISMPTVSVLSLGRRSNGLNMWNGTIRRFTYWPQRLPNSTLQTLTL